MITPNNPIKRSKASAEMKREKQGIVSELETHLSNVELEKLEKMEFNDSCFLVFVFNLRRDTPAVLTSNSVNLLLFILFFFIFPHRLQIKNNITCLLWVSLIMEKLHNCMFIDKHGMIRN